MQKPVLMRRAFAELFGTYALVTAGCGAIVVNSQTGSLGHVGIALTFGLVVVVMVAATGHLSGAHLNPAVTLAFAVARHFPWREAPVYIWIRSPLQSPAPALSEGAGVGSGMESAGQSSN